jgi:hypothetical protein
MYGYKEYKPLTKENIFEALDSQEDVFNLIINEEIKLDKEVLYKAPYREDKHGDCYFEYYKNILYFVDFPDGLPKNCIAFIMRCYNIGFLEAMELINNTFKLGLGLNNIETISDKKIIYNSIPKPLIEEKIIRDKTIKIFPRDFEIKDKKFWFKYGITKKQLIQDKVIPIKAFEAYNKKGELFNKMVSVGYAFTDFPKGRMKIYCPYENKRGKWFTNCNSNDIGNINNLKPSKVLIITKSYKDCRVLRNLGLNSIWFQNEGMIPNKKILFEILNRVPKIYVWFDNDTVGIAKSLAIVNYLKSLKSNISDDNIINITLPPILLEKHIKDPSDYIENCGKASLLDFINQKINN